MNVLMQKTTKEPNEILQRKPTPQAVLKSKLKGKLKAKLSYAEGRGGTTRHPRGTTEDHGGLRGGTTRHYGTTEAVPGHRFGPTTQNLNRYQRRQDPSSYACLIGEITISATILKQTRATKCTTQIQFQF